jgi:hypothetical protein
MVVRQAIARREMQGYDIRDDKALPNLQKAANKKGTYRYRALRL